MSNIIHVILTGGVGSRLWPLSRKSNPKQYLKLFKEGSLFAMTVMRNQTLCDQVTVVGNCDNHQLSQEVMDAQDIAYTDIIEATPRNTAAAIAFAAFAANPDDILIVTPSDHVIVGEEAYSQAMQAGIAKAQQGYIVTFGIKPVRPETGYGYIEFQEDQVLSFREKPNQDTAEDFIERGNFLWNSGMFCFRADTLLQELQQFEPQVYATALATWKSQKDGYLDESLSKKIPSISIDYAVMERSKKIRVVATEFAWSDLGSFESLYDYLVQTGHPVDENGNMVLGSDLYTAFVGLKNTIVVSTPDAMLFVQKEKSQDVKKVYNTLEKHQSKLID
ncbi:mannose-1-phosphate guanylyltransferase [Sphingobacterium corticibacter]|uniref:Mannose-1-phosphate guanylyltransferase n=1 Tax=Sphingobacterium corticibacter TaxID=2171749 RepID=A0A2T8HJF4_9SPHI|nr:sugar phosphate nucleotidyltransferase [Sphingobacterium corticibacter]PVH25578.1 mannose-1-phosphate guanylyltransferase [Sphingobacterium corticibacter]